MAYTRKQILEAMKTEPEREWSPTDISTTIEHNYTGNSSPVSIKLKAMAKDGLVIRCPYGKTGKMAKWKLAKLRSI